MEQENKGIDPWDVKKWYASIKRFVQTSQQPTQSVKDIVVRNAANTENSEMKKKPWAFKTMLLCMVTPEDNRINILKPFITKIERIGDNVKLELGIVRDINPVKECLVYVLGTDDPTIEDVQDPINLGYFRFYIILKNAKLVKKVPLTYTGKWSDMETKYHLPQRSIL